MVKQISQNNVVLPTKSKLISDIEHNLAKGLLEFNIKNRFMFPKYMPLDFYDLHYDDIKKEYLIDFKDSEENCYCLVPEYRTVIREYCKDNYKNSVNIDFYYIEDTMSFDSPERKNIITSKMFGVCSFNVTDPEDSYRQLTDALYSSLTFVCNEFKFKKKPIVTVYYDMFGKVSFSVNGVKVGYALNEANDHEFLSAHLNIMDIYNVIIKNKNDV